MLFKILTLLFATTTLITLIANLRLKKKQKLFSEQVDAKEFVANASHELRTPITVIKGFSETLRDMPELQGCNLAPSVLKKITSKIVSHCDRMESLIGRLLLLSKLDSKKMHESKPFQLLLPLDSALQQLKTRYPEAQITIENLDKPIITMGDSSLIELALFNILHNSVKYSKTPAKIEIQISGNKLSVKDQGVGIEKEELDHIFDRFYKTSQKTKESSFGLGLSIVKKIFDQHGTSIKVFSKPGMGTTVEMQFKALADQELPVT